VPAVLERFKRAVGCGWIEGPTSGEGYAHAYKWCAGADETLTVLAALWPWLGIVKRLQAIDVLNRVNDLPVSRQYAWRGAARIFAAEHAIADVAR
jgi:hypothetical protein